MWTPGDTVIHQEVWRGRLWAARPMRVIEDTPGRILLWMPHRTRRKVPITPPSRPDPPGRHRRVIENLDRGDWAFGEHVWDVSCLWILDPAAWHSTWVSWRPDGSHLGWYINFQMPMTRTSPGFEAMDLMLDVVAEPDLTWRWKDREEFDEIVDRGIFDERIAERVESEARSVIADIEHRRPPFDQPWPSWRPDPEWPLPELGRSWDHVDR